MHILFVYRCYFQNFIFVLRFYKFYFVSAGCLDWETYDYFYYVTDKEGSKWNIYGVYIIIQDN